MPLTYTIDEFRLNKSYLLLFSEDEENEQKSLNVRKSLRGPTNQPVAASVSSSTARKTLMQRKTEYNTNRNDNFGIQNSVFDLNVVECELTQLAYIHLTLEHLMSIENKMNISNGRNFICSIGYRILTIYVANICLFLRLSKFFGRFTKAKNSIRSSKGNGLG